LPISTNLWRASLLMAVTSTKCEPVAPSTSPHSPEATRVAHCGASRLASCLASHRAVARCAAAGASRAPCQALARLDLGGFRRLQTITRIPGRVASPRCVSFPKQAWVELPKRSRRLPASTRRYWSELSWDAVQSYCGNGSPIALLPTSG
jgi:hypothetical protein